MRLSAREALIKLRGARWHEIWMMVRPGAKDVVGPTFETLGDTSARFRANPSGRGFSGALTLSPGAANRMNYWLRLPSRHHPRITPVAPA
jgi:hypothetical protein